MLKGTSHLITDLLKHDSKTIPAQFWRDPAISYAESRRACCSRTCYKPHSHPTFSIGAVDAGGSIFTGAAAGPCYLRPGMMVFIPASSVHACNPLPDQSWSYQMLHLDARWLKALIAEVNNIPGDFISDREIRLIDDKEIYARFCTLNTVLFSDAGTEDKSAALIEFIGDCYCENNKVRTFQALSSCDSPAIKKLTDALLQTERQPWALAELADISGMSRYQLIRLFRAETGMTPHAWQLNARVNQARRWLQSGYEITDIAYRLGFADQSHFQRVFKAHTGVTPGSYRA
ncbi:AraC family transcriptional regulator [Nissabacter sp. SGAir0207]|uniref:AraC family transcriptional regulator n=1 Tax=Nissabacter sp. SGAir0207 TaxID=2126321 RepID=UPI0010CD6858|nr:AraC family transcriptional regulator [Nissabacter sp. SGAir0207]QCR38696.1 AraC family transcriptional regulator [Nissabacter sp. SGAir0207]